jgi:hypothetical protein
MTHDPMFTDGGVAQFRCFRPDMPDGYLRSLFKSDYRWEPGRQESDKAPTAMNGNGLWGFKTLPEAIYQEGDDTGLVFAMTRHWGTAVEHESGLRSIYAQIVAFIEPTAENELRLFPREYLRSLYPGVPIIEQGLIPDMVDELGLITLRWAKVYPLMQYSGPEGQQIWAPEVVGPSEAVENAYDYEMLEAAASYPDELHPIDQRLRKESIRTSSGDTYVFWKLLGDSWKVSGEVLDLARYQGEDMYRHRIGSPDTEGDR